MTRLQERLWDRCMILLKGYRKKASPSMTVAILRDASPYPNEEIMFQMKYDLKIYSLFDALAMWVGQGGLSEHHPKIKQVVAKIVNSAERGEF